MQTSKNNISLLLVGPARCMFTFKIYNCRARSESCQYLYPKRFK